LPAPSGHASPAFASSRHERAKPWTQANPPVARNRFARGVQESLQLGGHRVAIREQLVAAGQHLFDGIAKDNARCLQFGNLLGGVLISRAQLFGRCCLGGLLKKIRCPGQTLLGLREGDFVLVESVTQKRAADSLQFGRDLAHADRISGMHSHLFDLSVNHAQLPRGEASEHRTKQHQRAKAAIEPATNSEIEKRHGSVLAKCSELKSGRRNSVAGEADACTRSCERPPVKDTVRRSLFALIFSPYEYVELDNMSRQQLHVARRSCWLNASATNNRDMESGND
jgi:hypothetical protein